jgi:hypothetical protein
MPYISSPPTKLVIPVTLAADRTFSLFRKDSSGSPLDWNAAVYMTIDTSTATTVNATVTNNQAVFVISHTTCDECTNTTKWRLYMQPSGGLITPLAVGVFERDDGG